MLIYKYIADNQNPQSIGSNLRRKRFKIFEMLLKNIHKPAQILDIGGRQKFWENVGFLPSPEVGITLLNLTQEPISLPYFTSIIGDARSMPQFVDQQFDIVFSNSVIEHVGDYIDQAKMASEVQRVGQRYYIQTPNRYFPIEPHFVFPFFQFLPLHTRVCLVHQLKLGWRGQYPEKLKNTEAIGQEIASIQLLSEKEFTALFPKATIHKEQLWGLTKSFVACYQ